MRSDDPKKTPQELLTEINELLGPPPVLSIENVESYEKILLRFIVLFNAQDTMELISAMQLTDWTWEICRYTRMKTAQIQWQLGKSRQELKKSLGKFVEAKNFIVRQSKTDSSAAQASTVPKYTDIIEDLQKALNDPPTEIECTGALQAGAEFHLQLDYLLTMAISRKNDILEYIERYQGAKEARRASLIMDQILEAQLELLAPPHERELLGPPHEKDKVA